MIDLFELGEMIESKEMINGSESLVQEIKNLMGEYQEAVDEGFKDAAKVFEKELEELKKRLEVRHGAKESETGDYDIKKIIKSFNPRETLLAKKYEPNPIESEDIKDIIRDKTTRSHPPVFAEGAEVSDDMKEILDGTRPDYKIAAHQGEQLNDDVINELLEDTEPSDKAGAHQGEEISFGSTAADVERYRKQLEHWNSVAKSRKEMYESDLRFDRDPYDNLSDYRSAERQAQKAARELDWAQKHLET